MVMLLDETKMYLQVPVYFLVLDPGPVRVRKKYMQATPAAP